MPAQLTTKAQVNGYRFLLRRQEHALVRRDVRMLHDPMRSQLRALLVGLVLGVLVLGGCGVYGLIKPQGAVGKSKIIVSKNSGALYVLVGGKLHPVLNLASARLITASAESPKSVADKKLTSYPRGPLLGIPGAPTALPSTSDKSTSWWSVCDSTSGGAASASVAVTVLGNEPAAGRGTRQASASEAMLVSSGEQTYLIYDGKRAKIDTGDVAVRRALKLEGATSRPISTGLLNAIPEVSPIAVPAIADRGLPAALRRDGVGIGSVVKVAGLGGDSEFYVVLADGMQPVNSVAAEMIRSADAGGTAEVMTMSPGSLAGIATVNRLPVTDFPTAPPRVVTAADSPVACLSWSRGKSSREAKSQLLIGTVLPIPSKAAPVVLATADGAADGIDAAYIPPASGRYIQVTGADPNSPRAESLFYVSDSGIRFGISDAKTGASIGLGDRPMLAPWSIVSLLVPGPALSQQAALVSHDGMAPDTNGAQFQLPQGN